MEDRHEHDDLRRTAPTLAGLPKGDPFVVPDAFFEQLPHRVQGMVTKAPQRTGFNWWKRVAIALPVVALLAFGVRWFTNDRPAPLADVAAFTFEGTDLSDTELDDFDVHELLAASDVDASSLWANVDIELSDAEFLAYAEQEGLDITELIDRP